MAVILKLLLLTNFLSGVIVAFLRTEIFNPGKLDRGLKVAVPYVDNFFPYLGRRQKVNQLDKLKKNNK